MGITTKLETEDGTALATVEDPTNTLHRMLPQMGDKEYQCLSRIDWYGDAAFNHLQAEQFLSEWARLESRIEGPEDEPVIRQIRELAQRLQNETPY